MKKSLSENRKKSLKTALSYLPGRVSESIFECLKQYRASEGDISEIRLRSQGLCAITVRGANAPLSVQMDDADIKDVFKRLCGGAVFAHREDLCRGFVSLGNGVRVGVCGRARYERDGVLGISEISSLVFRIPSGECSFAHALYGEWLLHGGGMLICSRAGEGKTTAIRSLSRLIASGERPRRVVIVDERCEIDADGYSDAHVDVLRGYRRPLGVDIAIRTLSAEVLVVDEISSPDDSRAMLCALGAGVNVIATVHASSLSDAMRRSYVRELINGGLFDSACIIKRDGDRFSYRLENIEPADTKWLHGMGDI